MLHCACASVFSKVYPALLHHAVERLAGNSFYLCVHVSKVNGANTRNSESNKRIRPVVVLLPDPKAVKYLVVLVYPAVSVQIKYRKLLKVVACLCAKKLAAVVYHAVAVGIKSQKAAHFPKQ